MRDRLRFGATPSDGSFRCRGCSDRQRAELPQDLACPSWWVSRKNELYSV